MLSPTTDMNSAPIWRTPVIATLSAAVVLLGSFLYSPYGGMFYLFFIAPFAGLVGISWSLIAHEPVLRARLRWAVFSGHYKSKLLAQPNTGSTFRHLQWDEWGFVPGDNFVYLVYDPHDSLAATSSQSRALRIAGIPCEVPMIRRLETRWYFVQFYTDQQWENCRQAK